MVQLWELRPFSPMQILFWVFALVENPTYPCLHGVGWQLNVLSWLLVTYLPCWVSSVVTKHFVMEHRHQLKLVSVNCRCDQSVKANQLSGPPTDLKVMKQLCMAVFQNGNHKCSLLHFCRKVYIILTDVWFDKSAWLRIWPFQLYFLLLTKTQHPVKRDQSFSSSGSFQCDDSELHHWFKKDLRAIFSYLSSTLLSNLRYN